MSKILNYASILLMALTAFFANAEFSGPDNTPTYTTIAEAMTNAVSGSKVVLKGHIIQKTLEKQYVFRDSTAETTVYISKKALAGLEISPTTLVELEGVVSSSNKKHGKKSKISSPNHCKIRIASVKIVTVK